MAVGSEIAGFPKETWDLVDDGSRATRSILVDWSLRYVAFAQIIASPVYPYVGSALRVVKVDISPLEGKQSQPVLGLASYSKAVITITYDATGPETDDLITEDLEPSAEFTTLDHEDFTWSDDTALKEGEAPGRLLRGLEYVFKVHKTLVIPAAVLSLPGSVNNVQVIASTLGLAFNAETLLYQPPKISRTITTTGAGAFNLTHRMSYRPSGWNNFWRAKTQSYDTFKEKSSGLAYKNFPLADFSPIFP